jgi:demethoxyubiquinone hydroxylase (CLK1/Coq7/Cat5 family)
MFNTTKAKTQTIESLNELLRGELAAVETYNQALKVVKTDQEARRDLEECRSSHEDRVLRLRTEIRERGGEPSEASGAWGVFAKAVEGSAKAIGPTLAVSALEAGEDYGLREYEQLLPKLDTSARSIVSADIYPQQMRTHSIVSSLKRSMSAPSATG